MSDKDFNNQLWAGIDRLAESKGLSLAALAKMAGLDETTLSPNKRCGPDGTMRWPSFPTLDRLLTATGVSLREFFEMAAGAA